MNPFAIFSMVKGFLTGNTGKLLSTLVLLVLLGGGFLWYRHTLIQEGVASQQPIIQRLKANVQTAVSSNAQLMQKMQQLAKANQSLSDALKIDRNHVAQILKETASQTRSVALNEAKREQAITNDTKTYLSSCANAKVSPAFVSNLFKELRQ